MPKMQRTLFCSASKLLMNKHIPIDEEECSIQLVSLTSSTLGSSRLYPMKQHIEDDELLLKKKR